MPAAVTSSSWGGLGGCCDDRGGSAQALAHRGGDRFGGGAAGCGGASAAQAQRLLGWAVEFPKRTWAIEAASGLGFLLAQQLVAAGETVVDVPPTLVARTRMLATGRSNKNDPNDALSVAVTALRNTTLRRVAPVDHRDLLRLLSKRNRDIGNHRTRLVCRLHALLAELAPGGITKEIKASDVDRFLAHVDPVDAIEQTRYDLAVELLADIRRVDDQLKASHKRIRTAVAASDTTVTDIYGVGPIIAASLIGYSGDIARFANRDRYAAYNGTAPIEFSSGGRIVHRLSQRGNRHLNHALHMAAICQIRQTADGRTYFERSVAEGKTKREALRALKRHVSNAVYRQLLPTLAEPPAEQGPGGQSGATPSQRGRSSIPATGSSVRSLPDPPPPYGPAKQPWTAKTHPANPGRTLDAKRHRYVAATLSLMAVGYPRRSITMPAAVCPELRRCNGPARSMSLSFGESSVVSAAWVGTVLGPRPSSCAPLRSSAPCALPPTSAWGSRSSTACTRP